VLGIIPPKHPGKKIINGACPMKNLDMALGGPINNNHLRSIVVDDPEVQTWMLSLD
jgi:hypothetical protein